MLMRSFDLLVIGGGIHGAAVARDAAGRGLKVMLAEKGDYACATSSASSKLIHGGLRYLEHLELSLVRESLVERAGLLKTAPHLVAMGRDLRFLADAASRRAAPLSLADLWLAEAASVAAQGRSCHLRRSIIRGWIAGKRPARRRRHCSTSQAAPGRPHHRAALP